MMCSETDEEVEDTTGDSDQDADEQTAPLEGNQDGQSGSFLVAATVAGSSVIVLAGLFACHRRRNQTGQDNTRVPEIDPQDSLAP